jgi:hypothetical protein
MDSKNIAPRNWFREGEARPASTARTLVRLNRCPDSFPALRTELQWHFDSGLRPTYFNPPSDAPVSLRPAVDVSEGRKAYTMRA